MVDLRKMTKENILKAKITEQVEILYNVILALEGTETERAQTLISEAYHELSDYLEALETGEL